MNFYGEFMNPVAMSFSCAQQAWPVPPEYYATLGTAERFNGCNKIAKGGRHV